MGKAEKAGKNSKGRAGADGGGKQRGLEKAEKKGGGGVIHVALLRGINVGGKNMLPMGALVEFFEGAGCTGVRTYINSGNVVFAASAAAAKKAARVVEREIEKRFGFRSPVVIRSAEEMERIAAACPYDAGAIDHKRLYVGFLLAEPEAGRAAKLDPKRSPGDLFELCGREVYMHLGNGAAETKLTNAYFDSVLGTVVTGRNWRTVLRLVEMCGERSIEPRITGNN